MKSTMIALACALAAPLAFGQTSTTVEQTTAPAPVERTTEQTTTTTAPVTARSTETTTTYSAGTVTTYEPGKTIVVKNEQGPVSFALGTAARIVDGAGKIITAPLRSGQKVRIYYTGTGQQRVVEHVQVVED